MTIHLVTRAKPIIAVDGGETNNYTASRYLDFNNGTQMSATSGFVMAFSGSIVGVSCSAQVSAETTPGTIDFRSRIDGTNAMSITQTTSGVADYNWSGTQAAGIDTFSPGDTITHYMNLNTFVGTIHDTCAVIYLELDI
jgi:hypothetical protein